IVEPRLAKQSDTTASATLLPASSSSAPAATLPIRSMRSLAAGPSGDMRPIDPYADATPSLTVAPTRPASTSLVTTPTTSSVPTTDGPITMPSQLVLTSTPIAPTSATGTTCPCPTTPPIGVTAPHATSPATPTPSATPSASFATSPRVRRFDPVFERYRGSVPIEYVRALVERESSGNYLTQTGSALGLMQIVPVVLDDYNKRHGTPYQREHLFDPSINVAIGCELLRLIIDNYRKHHPRIANLQGNWSNPRFVELLTFGWNAGYSEAGGVGRVARYLEGLGAVDITMDQVSAHAKLAGASKHLSNPAKLTWCKSVVALYLREPRSGVRPLWSERSVHVEHLYIFARTRKRCRGRVPDQEQAHERAGFPDRIE
ncbi:MAG TPA: transglycosylase SLT domain-containing protein, partial [Kofleriaceae bacterium]|nr:transglycosylase SLT domain-containing protein [Kofleriaceae bacterium]